MTSPPRPHPAALALFVALSLSLLPAWAVAAPDAVPEGPALGLILDGPVPSALAAAPAGDAPRTTLPVRLTARWGDVERRPGVFDWSDTDRRVAMLGQAGHPVVLCLTGTNALHVAEGELPSPAAGGSLEAWLGFVRSAVRAFAGRVAVFEIWDDPSRAGWEAATYAFVLKQSALAVRAEARLAGEDARVAQGALAAGELEWQRGLWRNDTAAYVDVLPLRVVAGNDPGGLESAISALITEALAHPPAPALWAWVEPAPGGEPWSTASGAVRALAAGVSVAAAAPPGDRSAAPEDLATWALATQRVLDEGYAAAPLGRLELTDESGRPVPGGRALGRFLSDEDFSSLIVYEAPAAAGQADEARLVIDGTRVRNARTIDPLSGRDLRTAAREPADGSERRWLRVPLRRYPMLALFQRAMVSPGFELPPETLEVESQRGLTAEEIIARYQQVQKFQDDRLERWIAKGRIDFHFKLAQGGSTVDVSIASNYFWERGSAMEWEQTDYYVNGNRVRWKKIPELPLIQPEKVITLPLDLTLDRTYVYRLVGEGDVDGRAAYVLAFDPESEEGERSLYRGRVWIDRETFQRLKVSLVQTRMDAPVLSNEERDLFRPQQGPGGTEFWLLSEIDGQQVWTAGGRNFIVRREVTFESFEINPPRDRFEERRAAAYASTNQMLRDTDEGFRYLERQADGSRTVKQGVDTNQLFAAAGAFKDSSRDLTPLGGVNYFDYDFLGRKVQLNVLFAGALAFVTASKPELFGRKIDFTAEATGVGIRFDRKVFVADRESEFERTRSRPQNLGLRLGVPLGKFVKLNLVGDATWRDFSLSDEAKGGIDTFNQDQGASLRYLVPEDHVETAGTLELEFNRRGFTVAASASAASRSDWKPFGLFDEAGGTFLAYTGGDLQDPASYVPIPDPPLEDSYRRWQLSAFKEWYLPKFQKLRGEVNLLDGSALDQFSRYEFSFFGDDRLNGFSGSGVRFDEGLIARAGYSFNLFEVIRLDAALENAWVEERDSPAGRRSFTGLGLSANLVGPWKTVINLIWGVALASDIPELEGEQEFLLLVFKLF